MKKKRKWTIKANKRAGRPNYSLDYRKYPDYMPATTKGVSEPIIGIWHSRRRLLWKLGHLSIDGVRSDAWTTYTPDEIICLYGLIDQATEILKKEEDKYYARIKEEEKIFREGILKDVFDRTDAFLEQRRNQHKQCLNQIGVEEMAKMSFEQMVEWSNNIKEYKSEFNFLKLTQGIHCVRFLSNPDEDYFRSYTQHDCGQQKEFRSWLCWDYIMDNKEVREYLEQKELLTEADAKKAKKYGDPVCATMDVIKKYIKNMEPIYNSLRTKRRCIFNVFYIYQAYPDIPEDKRIKPGVYILEKSIAFNKLVISAMLKDKAMEIDDEDDNVLSLVSADKGKIVSIQVEGEGIGKNKRTYAIDFKGRRGPIQYTEDGSDPFRKGAQRVTLPDNFQIYNLIDVEAMRFLPYQEVINQIKSIPVIARLLHQIGYEIPGDEPSDNPLDDNYDKDFAQRTVGRPIAKPSIKEDSPLRRIKEKDTDDEEMSWTNKRTGVKTPIKEVKPEIDEDEISWEDEDEFTKAVPKSDPNLEEIKPKTKRKIF